MALSANRDLKFYASQELLDLPVKDNVDIYKGAFVGIDASTGYARPLTAGDPFAGIAYQQADNTGTGHADGAIRVRLHQHVDIVHAITATVANVGAAVYASDDGTLTLTEGSNSAVGTLIGIESTGIGRVRCAPTFG